MPEMMTFMTNTLPVQLCLKQYLSWWTHYTRSYAWKDDFHDEKTTCAVMSEIMTLKFHDEHTACAVMPEMTTFMIEKHPTHVCMPKMLIFMTDKHTDKSVQASSHAWTDYFGDKHTMYISVPQMKTFTNNTKQMWQWTAWLCCHVG